MTFQKYLTPFELGIELLKSREYLVFVGFYLIKLKFLDTSSGNLIQAYSCITNGIKEISKVVSHIFL